MQTGDIVLAVVEGVETQVRLIFKLNGKSTYMCMVTENSPKNGDQLYLHETQIIKVIRRETLSFNKDKSFYK